MAARLRTRDSARRRPRRLLLAITIATVAIAGLTVSSSVADVATASTVPGSPVGKLVAISQRPGAVLLSGYAADPDTRAPIRVVINIDHERVGTTTANRTYSGHGKQGFAARLRLGEGTHRVCAWAENVGRGTSVWLRCQTLTFDYGPVGKLGRLTTRPGAVWAMGWTYDADAPTAPVTVRVTVDGVAHTVSANDARAGVPELSGSTGRAHGFSTVIPAAEGKHEVCVSGTDIGYGADNTLLCRTLVIDDSPFGAVESIGASAGKLRVQGWAIDLDAPTTALQLNLTIDGKPATMVANVNRSDVGAAHPVAGGKHGFDVSYPLPEGLHRVCVTARNVGNGTDRPLQCKSATLSFTPTATLYPLTATSSGVHVIGWAADPDTTKPVSVRVTVDGAQTQTVPANATGPHHSGKRFDLTLALKSGVHKICAIALNAGYGSTDSAPVCRTFTPAGSAPADQRSPAPVATSRYIRNIRGSSSSELAMMRREGATDASHNPSGHRYLVLLDIGGQDQYDGGVVLSAGVRFVTYGDLVRDVQAYVSGYHSAQRSGAPVTIAVGTNNDMDVSYTSGKTWAQTVVNPIASAAKGYANLSIAGANDIEPGFRASYSQTKDWLSGYLDSTSRPFVFNGSADGCAWTVTDRSCNNGWSMSGLYRLAAGAAPKRMINLPQIYNYTMADQWKYISLTGLGNGRPRINFGGPLTEWTACEQDGGCGSLTGPKAWAALWASLQSDSRLKVGSLPYSTDLRIDW